MSYPGEPDWTCPKLDNILDDINEVRDTLEKHVESIREDNTLLRSQAHDHYYNWTEAKDEIDRLEDQLEDAHTRISELENELAETERQFFLLKQITEA